MAPWYPNNGLQTQQRCALVLVLRVGLSQQQILTCISVSVAKAVAVFLANLFLGLPGWGITANRRAEQCVAFPGGCEGTASAMRRCSQSAKEALQVFHHAAGALLCCLPAWSRLGLTACTAGGGLPCPPCATLCPGEASGKGKKGLRNDPGSSRLVLPSSITV